MSGFKDLKNYLSLSAVISLAFLIASIGLLFFFINMVKIQTYDLALLDAEAKSKILLDRNLATHHYFSKILKPRVFELLDKIQDENYFEPAWMSSTYAIRKIDSIFGSLNNDNYYYKESAVNARSPENEADEFERSFIEELKFNPSLRYRSLVREINGESYFVTLRRGEVLQEGCLKCHSTPDKAPKELVDKYGTERSFNRKNKELVSAVSIRVPLSVTYGRAEQFSQKMSKLFFLVILIFLVCQYIIFKFLISRPLAVVSRKAIEISDNNEKVGDEIPLPLGREFSDLTDSFNRMSKKLRYQFDILEEKNVMLQNALNEIKTLQGIIPICSYCKKIRDDHGAWGVIEEYLCNHSEAQFTHGVCPECYKKQMDELVTAEDFM
ncbi:MAG: DUF3365 domain-containing protein [Candidatus Electrothrix sp. AR4]|nr:DUF3365 domain-containing protein [Candidatus Electrothrix sp. AR4]